MNESHLLFYLTRRINIILTLLGVAALAAGWGVPSQEVKPVLWTAASILVTLGVGLPIAIYYQSRHNQESFELLKSCDEAGIRAIFASRTEHEDAFHDAVDRAAASSDISLLGIAFRGLFDPNRPTSVIGSRIDSPDAKLRVLLLDPDSEAARRREEIEVGGPTMDDIRATIDRGLPSTVQARLHASLSRNPDIKQLIDASKSSQDNARGDHFNQVAREAKIEVRLYDYDPIAFIMAFDDFLFSEQYHFGRVEGMVKWGGCIGKHVPVLQYRSDSKPYKFLSSHFNYVWDHSRDITIGVLEAAIARM